MGDDICLIVTTIDSMVRYLQTESAGQHSSSPQWASRRDTLAAGRASPELLAGRIRHAAIQVDITADAGVWPECGAAAVEQQDSALGTGTIHIYYTTH